MASLLTFGMALFGASSSSKLAVFSWRGLDLRSGLRRRGFVCNDDDGWQFNAVLGRRGLALHAGGDSAEPGGRNSGSQCKGEKFG